MDARMDLSDIREYSGCGPQIREVVGSGCEELDRARMVERLWYGNRNAEWNPWATPVRG